MRERIEIILADGNTLDLSNDISFPLNYQIDDIRNPSSTNGNYSKTIKIPGTKNNNIRLGNLFDINSDFTYFNPNIKTFGKIVVDYVTVMDGYFQLRDIQKLINVDEEGNEIQYDIVFFENVSDLFGIIGNKFIDELDFSELDHIISHSAITTTWTQDYTYGYLYPMLKPNEGGYNFKANDFKPAIYHRALLEKILSSAGYTFGGSFFTDGNEEFYNKEVIPFTNKGFEYNAEALTAKEFRAGILSGYSFTLADVDQFEAFADRNRTLTVFNDFMMDDDSTLPNFDNGNNYDANTYVWTVNSSSVFDLSINVDAQITFSMDNQHHPSATSTPYDPHPYVEDNYPLFIAAQVFVNNTEHATINSEPFYIYPNVIFKSTDVVENISFTLDILNGVTLQTGDEVQVKLFYFTKNAYTYLNGYEMISEILNTSFIKNKTVKNVNLDGDTIEMNDYLPHKLKQSDVLLDLQRRYNLYFRLDPNNTKKILISTRDEFYSDGETLDWSDKKDLSIESITLLSDLQDKKLLFTYKSDDDEANKNYTDSTDGDIYGQKRIEYTNEFTTSEKKIESPFSPTPLIYSDTQDYAMIVPSIEFDSNIRVLYFGGLLDVNGIDNWTYVETDRDSNGFTHTTYPYIGHFDNPINPTIDLNFGSNDFYYYNELVGTTDNTLYDRYWANYVNQVSESKLLNVKLQLTIDDIGFIRENMNAKIWLNNSYYFINKIIDFNPNSEGLTSVELIKFIPFNKFDPFAIPTGTTEVGTTIDLQILDNLPFRQPRHNIFQGEPILLTGNTSGTNGRIGAGSIEGALSTNVYLDNQILSPDSLVVGHKNIVSKDNSNNLIVGDNNLIKDNTSNSGILGGNDNTIDTYVENSWLIGTSDKTITQDNEIWIGEQLHMVNGTVIPTYNILKGGRDELRDIFASSDENIVNGGKDELRAQFTSSVINIVRG